MITKDISQNLGHYTLLSLILTVSLGFLAYFRYQTLTQQMILILTAIAYVIWGVFHHQQANDLSLKIVLEYAMIALLMSLLLNAVLITQ